MRVWPPVVLVALLCSTASFAQTIALSQTERFRSITLPPTSAALADDSTALAVNPAGLSGVSAPTLFYAHERDIGRNQVADGLYLADSIFGLGLAFSTDWMRGSELVSYRKTRWGLSLGPPTLALGLALNVFSSEQSADLNGLTSVDLGLLFRPARLLSLGTSVKNVGAPNRGDISLSRQYDFGLGLRPVDERYTLGLDYVFLESNNIGGGRLAYSLQAEVSRGIVLSGGVSHGLRTPDLAVQLGITFNGAHWGLTYAAGGASGGVDHLLGLRASLDAYSELGFPRGKTALVDLQKRLSTGRNPLGRLVGLNEPDPYLRLMEFLEQASEDGELSGIVLKVDGLSRVGMAKAEELRAAIYHLRAKHKKVVALLLTADDTSYSIAAAADKIYALPQSALLVNGLSARTTFVGTAMNKLGVHWDVARVGAFKSAPDALTRSGMSAPEQEALNAYLDTDIRQYEASVWKGRNLSASQLQAVFREGLIAPSRAKALGLVDDVIVPEKLEKQMSEFVPGSRYDPGYSFDGRRTERWGARPKIALIPILGSISGGKSRQGPLGQQAIAGAETVVAALKQASEDSTIAAIVIRVDSGGGDGVASDLMYRAVNEAKKRKPVVSSMGDVAASGGYYAAMGADEVFANATTLTGSIGVFVVKPAVGNLAAKLGITQQTLSRGPMTELLNVFKPWSPEEQAAAQRWVDAFYDEFISEVSLSRHLAKARVNALAQGRVWSGEDAHSRGLVDALGGIAEAIQAAKRRAGIQDRQEVDLVTLGEAAGALGAEGNLLGQLSRVWLPNWTEPASPLVAQWAEELGLEAVLFTPGLKASLPFYLKVE